MDSEPDGSDEIPRQPPLGQRPAEPCHDDASCWIRAARSGSIEAFGQLFERCRGYLLTLARQEVGVDLREKTRPSDVVQQTLITAQKCFSRFEGASEAELLAWLRGILLNHISDLSKFFHREKRNVDRELSLERDLQGDDRGELVADERMTPGLGLARDEEAQIVVGAVSRLPADYRDVIVLRNWECLAWEEVGSRMQRSAEAARKLWARALEVLRKEIDQSDGRPGQS